MTEKGKRAEETVLGVINELPSFKHDGTSSKSPATGITDEGHEGSGNGCVGTGLGSFAGSAQARRRTPGTGNVSGIAGAHQAPLREMPRPRGVGAPPRAGSHAPDACSQAPRTSRPPRCIGDGAAGRVQRTATILLHSLVGIRARTGTRRLPGLPR